MCFSRKSNIFALKKSNDMNKTKLWLVLMLVAVTVVTCINPIYPQEQILQHAGTLLLMLPLAADVVRNRMPSSAFIGIVCFTLLHIVGARYIYSYVPYREWFAAVGVTDAAFLQGTRNHYDRLVHFSFGLLMFPCLVWLCRRWVGQRQIIPIIVAWLIVQTGSMIYELFEWTLTIVMTSEEADYYNGQQGDMWDAQKDMALAMAGSSVAAVCYLVKSKFRR